MKHRIARASVLASSALVLLALTASSAPAAPSPWWQVLTGSHPTNLWEPKDSEWEVETEAEEFGPFGSVAIIEIKVGGEVVGCLGIQSEFGNGFCGLLTGFPATETAAQLETLLKSAFGTEEVAVAGGPVGNETFKIIASGAVPALVFTALPENTETEPEASFGSVTTKIVSVGGSGRLVLTITNLGDAPVDATVAPVTISDKLPQGVIATGVEGFAGAQDFSGPVDCAVDTGSLINCTFEGILPSYEAIEVEVMASLTGEPPVAGVAGKVTVSGGNAPAKSATQEVKMSPDQTPFGIERFLVQAEEEGGGPVVQAGGHPFQLTTTLQLNSGVLTTGAGRSTPPSIEQPALPRNLRFSLPAGLVGNATATRRCQMNAFFETLPKNSCAAETAIGVASVTVIEKQALGLTQLAVPVFNLPPAPGEPARFGFTAKGAPVVIDTEVDTENGYRVFAEVRNATQVADFLSSNVILWGSPSDPRHDSSRGWECTNRFPSEGLGPCERPSGLKEVAFLRQPVSCVTPLDFGAEIEPWNVPLGSVIESATFNGGTMSGCNQVPFDPTVGASPGSNQAGGPSGLDFQLEMPIAGLLDPSFKAAEGQAKKVEVILPQGMTVNPSQAEGLGACSPSQYAQETASSPSGQGCPDAAKVGTVQVKTPLLEEEVKGSLYVAEPYDNPFNSLLAIYMVAKVPERGILVKQAGKVALDPVSGQIVTTFDELPQIPFETFDVQFFEGNRAPLVMPPTCGDYQIVTKFTPWSASNPFNPLPSEIVERVSPFTVDQGSNGGPCPSGTPPFNPGFTAGTENNAAGSYSPFNARLTRNDDEQEFTSFSMKLPKGVIGKIAGIPFCPDIGIAAARARTGPSGGQEELDSPSCPAASQIGRTLVGAGVGPELSYAPGKIYLAGPYLGSKLSIVAIATAKVGPFDLGNVVIRQALRVDPNTAEVTSDGAGGDPIPHILQGIVVHARDIRVFIDRPEFVLNPTNCERMTAAASILSSGNQLANVSSPFQAADCASLGLKPKLSIQLLGGTKRTAKPRLKAVFTARKGDANLNRAQVTLPRSEFLEQAHIRTVCTRVQFNAGGGNGEQCPKGAVYGKAKATSPLLDETLSGPVFLRSSNHELPDLVAALHSPRADINLVGRIDSVNGGIRTTFEGVPDAPVTKFTLEMQGGKKGLIVNSTDICKGEHHAKVSLKGQNGRRYEFNPVVKPKCGGKKGKGGKGK
ncbi:MAG TPA: hypothetical protein VKB23_02560 [Solirubrobacterales bacterium]|nr:hypothetical protein [Solirubrobacterales bacterium]